MKHYFIFLIIFLISVSAMAATRTKEPVFTKQYDPFIELSDSIFDDKTYPSDNGFVIWERIKTPKGYLTNEISNDERYHLFLEQTGITTQDHISLIKAVREKNALPSVVVTHMYTGGYDPMHEYEKPYIIDVATDPIFISENYMPIVSTEMTVGKKDADTYIFSGPSFLEKGKTLHYTYRRGTGKLVQDKNK